MSQIVLSDGQTIESTDIQKVELFGEDLLITMKSGQLKVHGSGVKHDVSELDAVRDREQLSYGVFRR